MMMTATLHTGGCGTDFAGRSITAIDNVVTDGQLRLGFGAIKQKFPCTEVSISWHDSKSVLAANATFMLARDTTYIGHDHSAELKRPRLLLICSYSFMLATVQCRETDSP